MMLLVADLGLGEREGHEEPATLLPAITNHHTHTHMQARAREEKAMLPSAARTSSSNHP